MTYTKLIERLHEIASVQGFPTDDLVDAADAIEALQEKNALLEGTLESRERNITELQAENERLKDLELTWRICHERSSDAAFDLANNLSALQAKLSALQTQEQVQFLADATRFKLTFDAKGRVSTMWAHMEKLEGRWVALVAAEDDCHLKLAAPKALEPLTAKEDWDIRGILASKLRVFHRATEAEVDELISLFAYMKSRTPLTQPEVVEAFCNTRHNTQYVSVFDAGVRFAEKHHGITKGTPT